MKRLLLPLLVVVLVLAVAGPASANPSNLTPELLADYDVTVAQLARISTGDFPNGTWQPLESVTRGEAVKMAVRVDGIKLANPKIPSYTDVLRSDPLYKYVEGATAAGWVSGVGDGSFQPGGPIAGVALQAMIAVRLGYDLDPAYTYGSNPLSRIEAASMLLHSTPLAP